MKVTAPFEPAIVARQLEPMLAFYRDALGMRVFSIDTIAADTARLAGLAREGYTIARLETAGGDRLKIAVPADGGPTPAPPPEFVMDRHGLAYLTFIVPDLRGVLQTLRRQGSQARTGDEPVPFRPGVVELAFVRDPEGNLIELVQRNDLASYRPAQHGSGS